MAYYEAALRDLPSPVESLTVNTRFGATHIIAAGDPSARPLLLLHGLGDTALLWKPLLAGLSLNYRLYAPDIPGHPGKSASVRLPYEGPGYLEWLQDALDQLGLDSTDVVGLSLGAFLALRLSTAAPRRVGKLILLSPAGMASVKWSSMFRLMPVGLFPTRANIRRFMERNDVIVTDQSVDWACLISRHFVPPPPPPVISPDELRRVNAPVFLLVGQNDFFFDADTLVRCARQYLPDLAAANVVSGAGHNLVRERADIVQAFVLSALDV